MANWSDLITYVRSRYEIMEQSSDSLWFELPTKDDRTQAVIVRHRPSPSAHDWIQIESPIARVEDVDLRKLLELAGEAIVGGAAVVNGLAVYRHAVPLDDMSWEEFDRPFQLVVSVADEFEQALTGSDRF